MAVAVMLAADLGGTNTTLAIVEWDGKPVVRLKKSYLTCDVKSVPLLIKEFLSHVTSTMYPAQACFGVAGPVVQTNSGKVVTMTNTNLVVREKDLFAIGFRRAHIVNDFVALGRGVDVLQNNEQKILQKGSSIGTKAVIGVGTGLGMAIVARDVAIASEGGHMELPLRLGEEDFARFLQKKVGLKAHEPIDAEYALCGDGVERIYEYFAKKKLSVGDILLGKEKSMIEAQRFFLELLARVCRNLCLVSHSVGGIYIGGGVVRKNTHLFNGNFARQITSGKDFGLKNMNVSIITSEDTSLLGAAIILRERGKK